MMRGWNNKIFYTAVSHRRRERNNIQYSVNCSKPIYILFQRRFSSFFPFISESFDIYTESFLSLSPAHAGFRLFSMALKNVPTFIKRPAAYSIYVVYVCVCVSTKRRASRRCCRRESPARALQRYIYTKSEIFSSYFPGLSRSR